MLKAVFWSLNRIAISSLAATECLYDCVCDLHGTILIKLLELSMHLAGYDFHYVDLEWVFALEEVQGVHACERHQSGSANFIVPYDSPRNASVTSVAVPVIHWNSSTC